MISLYMLPFIIFFIFLIMFLRNRYRIINGFVFDCFLGTSFFTITLLLISDDNIISYTLAFIVVFIILFILTFGIFILLIFLIINSIKVFKRESHALANMLTLILAVIILVQILLFSFESDILFSKYLNLVTSIAVITEALIFSSIMCYLTIAVIVSLIKPPKDMDFIIVLGCGLLEGNRVSPLLQGRINAAIMHYNKQKYIGKSSKIIMSGGQGKDELLPEAVAMKEYALSRGIPDEDILVEDKSKTTTENIRFSKVIMDNLWDKKRNYKCCFTTNGYHVFRAGIFAKNEGLKKAYGLGSKTAFYFVPNAFLREYVAVMKLRLDKLINITKKLAKKL